MFQNHSVFTISNCNLIAELEEQSVHAGAMHKDINGQPLPEWITIVKFHKESSRHT